MRNGRRSAGAAWGGMLLGGLVLLASSGAARAESCDENDPASPAASARITLGASDFTDDAHDELRSFVVTGSLGRVSAAVVSAAPSGIVRSLSAAPVVSNYSPDDGEQLKGIDIRIALKHGERDAVVSVTLRQVCAQHFRDSFLY